jgi:hypothetical protein
MAETTKIKLVHKDKEQEFDLKHAQRILKLQEKNKLNDWAIAPKQPFEFKNGVINPTSKGQNTDAGK